MKKIFILIVLILISVTGFSQLKPVYTVDNDSTAFGLAIPKKTLVFDYGANILYRVDTFGNMSSTVKTLGLDKVNSGFSDRTDSLHLYQEFGIDTIKSSGNTVVNNGLVIKDYLMPLHKGAGGKVLTMSATGDSVFWGSSGAITDTSAYSYLSGNSDFLQGIDTSYLLNRYWNKVADTLKNNVGNISINGNLTSTNGNFYGSNNGWFCGYDTLFEGVLKLAGVGKFKGSFLMGTYRINGNAYIENTDATFFGFQKKINNVIIKGSGVPADTNKISIERWLNDKKTATIYSDTAIITEAMDKMIMSADSGGNHFKVYVPTITKNLTVHGTITSGGLINKDTVINLGDGKTFNFPTQSVGWAEIQCDSVLTELTWGNVSWNGDGATSLRSNGAKFVNTDIDGNYACFYDGGSSYAILKNTSGYTQTYSIKYHYHY